MRERLGAGRRRDRSGRALRRLWLLLGCALLLTAGCAAGSARPRTARLPKDFLPDAVAFWSTSAGITSGVDPSTNTVYLAGTSDGGRTWQVRLRLPEQGLFVAGTFVATAGPGHGWLTFETCVASGGYPFDGCRVHAMRTLDGGAHWAAGGPQSVLYSFVGRQGWAIVPQGGRQVLERMTAAKSGPGLKATRVPAPCPGAELGAVAALGGRRALLVCGGAETSVDSGVAVQAKQFYGTSDGGGTWHRILSVPGGRAASALGVGTVRGMTFVGDGRGWLRLSRGGLYATTDGGRTWRPNGLVGQLELEEALSVSFVDRRTGYALLQGRPGGPYVSLMATRDGGATWAGVDGWTPPKAASSP